jgi:hypothetical protein
MEKMNKFFWILFLFVLVVFSGCAISEADKQEEYEKCNSVCASVLEEDFVTLKLCNDECKKKFLE